MISTLLIVYRFIVTLMSVLEFQVLVSFYSLVWFKSFYNSCFPKYALPEMWYVYFTTFNWLLYMVSYMDTKTCSMLYITSASRVLFSVNLKCLPTVHKSMFVNHGVFVFTIYNLKGSKKIPITSTHFFTLEVGFFKCFLLRVFI